MVKFSKELEAQLIPEWKEAFVNYKLLKKHIKKIKLSRLSNHPPPKPHFGLSIFDSLRFLSDKFCASHNNNNNDLIQVRRSMDDEESEEQVVYETELAQLFSEEDQVRVFFGSLDEELNKVNQFYKKQETEFLERGEALNKQLQILLDLKQLLVDRRSKNASPNPSNIGIFPHSPESLGESDERNSEMDEVMTTLERNGVSFVNNSASTKGIKTKKGKPKMAMRIDIPATTPTRAITAVTSMLWEDLVNNPVKHGGAGDFINKRKIQYAEKMIRSAFVELYKGLGLLKTYSSLNMEAFSKILKKFDKAQI